MTGPTATPRPGVSVQPSPYAVPHSPSARWTPAGPPIPQFRVGPKQIDWLPNQDLVATEIETFGGGSNGASHGFTDGIFDFGFNTGLTPTYTNVRSIDGGLSFQVDSSGTGTCGRSANIGNPLSATVGLETALLGVRFFVYFETITTVTAATALLTVNDASAGPGAAGVNIAQLALRAPANQDLTMRDNTTAGGASFIPAAGQWYRVEWLLDQNAGRQFMRMWTLGSLYSTDVAAASVNTNTSLTAVASRMSQLRIGLNVAAGNALKFQISQLVYDTRGWVSDYLTPVAVITSAGSVDLGGQVQMGQPATGSGSLTLGGSAAAQAPIAATGSLTLGGNGLASALIGGAGSLTLGGSGTAAAPITATGSLTLGGSATWTLVATGSLTLGGSGTAAAPITATGSLTLGGSGTAAAPIAATGSLTLGGSATASGSVSATGSLTLGGSAAAAAPITATGSLTLGGSAVSPGVNGSGSLTLGGSGTAKAAVSASGSLTLGGSASGKASVSATGSLTLSGSAAAKAAVVAAGSIDLGGSALPSAPATATGSIVLGGSATAGLAALPAAGTGFLVLGGSATAVGFTPPLLFVPPTRPAGAMEDRPLFERMHKVPVGYSVYIHEDGSVELLTYPDIHLDPDRLFLGGHEYVLAGNDWRVSALRDAGLID